MTWIILCVVPTASGAAFITFVDHLGRCVLNSYLCPPIIRNPFLRNAIGLSVGFALDETLLDIPILSRSKANHNVTRVTIQHSYAPVAQSQKGPESPLSEVTTN